MATRGALPPKLATLRADLVAVEVAAAQARAATATRTRPRRARPGRRNGRERA